MKVRAFVCVYVFLLANFNQSFALEVDGVKADLDDLQTTLELLGEQVTVLHAALQEFMGEHETGDLPEHEKDITKDERYIRLNDAKQQPLANFSNDQLEELIKYYKALLKDIQAGDFTIAKMPIHFVDLERKLKNELTRRKEKPGKQDVTKDERYVRLEKASKERPDQLSINALEAIIADYATLKADMVYGKKFATGQLPEQLEAFVKEVRAELKKREQAGGKTKLEKDTDYQALFNAIGELKTIKKIPDDRLQQLLKHYKNFEEKIESDKFTTAQMPKFIVGIEPKIDLELTRRKYESEVGAKSKEGFVDWEDILNGDVKKYGKKGFDLFSLDVPTLNDLIERIEVWKEDKRRDKSYEEGFKRLLLGLVKARERNLEEIMLLRQSFIFVVAGLQGGRIDFGELGRGELEEIQENLQHYRTLTGQSRAYEALYAKLVQEIGSKGTKR